MFYKYVINDGDTASSIAKKYNVSEDVIKKLNENIDFATGNTVLIPKENAYFNYYVVKAGDTLYKIASDNKIDPVLLAALNGINVDDYIYDNQVIIIPKAGNIIYISALGDTLSGIAKGLGISENELIKQNDNLYLQPEQLILYKYK